MTAAERPRCNNGGEEIRAGTVIVVLVGRKGELRAFEAGIREFTGLERKPGSGGERGDRGDGDAGDWAGVVGLGGNELLSRGERGTGDDADIT